MNKNDVLQRANEYCNERGYDESTLTSEFKSKFADFFVKKYPEGDINDDAIIADLKFNLDTAKSASAQGRTSLQQEFTAKENNYKTQIADLESKIKTPQQQQQQEAVLSEEVQNQLKELQAYKDAEQRKEKLANIIAIAKKDIRPDMHASFDDYVKTYNVELDKDDEEQAKTLHSRFQSIMGHSYGDIRPKTPKQTQQSDEAFIATIPKVSVS